MKPSERSPLEAILATFTGFPAEDPDCASPPPDKRMVWRTSDAHKEGILGDSARIRVGSAEEAD